MMDELDSKIFRKSPDTEPTYKIFGPCKEIEQDIHIFMPARLLATILIYIVNHQRTTNCGKALEGVHGIHVVPHSPFTLEEINQQGDFSQSTCGSLVNRENQQLLLQFDSIMRVWEQRPGCVRPIRCCINGDRNPAERVANVLTSIPFIALGLQTPSLYHSSRDKIRKNLRWLDYTMIATAAIFLSRALRNENPKLLMAASAALLPIQSLMVSVVHTGMMEFLYLGVMMLLTGFHSYYSFSTRSHFAFVKRALKDPDLILAHNLHKMSFLFGGCLFIADDMLPSTLLSFMLVGILPRLLVSAPAISFLSSLHIYLR